MTAAASGLYEIIGGARYIAHLHTTYTDGHNSVEDYCRWADGHGIEILVFAEHIRINPSYDVAAFLGDIDRARKEYSRLRILSGFEAKLLPGGGLDIAEETAEQADVMYFACHGFPGDEREYAESFTALFYDKRWHEKLRVWAHPGIYYQKRGINPSESEIFGALLAIATAEGIVIERNLRYGLAPEPVAATLDPRTIIIGCDAHSIDDLGRLEPVINEM